MVSAVVVADRDYEAAIGERHDDYIFTIMNMSNDGDHVIISQSRLTDNFIGRHMDDTLPPYHFPVHNGDPVTESPFENVAAATGT